MPLAEQSDVSIQLMTDAHVPAALQLCRAAGWNQLRADWIRLLRYEPAGCFVAMADESLVGTVTTTRYGRRLAWIGMMLVDAPYRRQGIASRLMHRSIEYLQDYQTECIQLDATPAGQKVYERLGFEVEWTFHRWRREVDVDTQFPQRDVSKTTPLNDRIIQLDKEVFGADRKGFLKQLSTDSAVRSEQAGYGMVRPGFLASYLGPVCAREPSVADAIVGKLVSDSPGPIFWDIPAPNESAIQLAERSGFEPVRELTRMRLGDRPIDPDWTCMYAISGPATG